MLVDILSHSTAFSKRLCNTVVLLYIKSVFPFIFFHFFSIVIFMIVLADKKCYVKEIVSIASTLKQPYLMRV